MIKRKAKTLIGASLMMSATHKCFCKYQIMDIRIARTSQWWPMVAAWSLMAGLVTVPLACHWAPPMVAAWSQMTGLVTVPLACHWAWPMVAAWSLMTGLVTVLLACHWAWPCSVLDVRFRASKGTEEDLHIFFYTYFFWKYVFNLKIARTNITFVVSPLSDLMN